MAYDALLVFSFGGPEGHDDVMPFLERVTRGRGIPQERLAEVAEHYHHFGGVSPINAQNRALIDALRVELDTREIGLPIYFGNRNWHPLVADTLVQMDADGVKNALVLVTSAFGSFSGCRQYQLDMSTARHAFQEAHGREAPALHKLRLFFNHPGYIEAVTDGVRQALASFDEPAEVPVVFTAHSIPTTMANSSPYVTQLTEACELVLQALGRESRVVEPSALAPGQSTLVYQSRSGPPQIPWLEPDILDHMQSMHSRSMNDLVIVPIGFISDHMEVIFDLDTEAVQLAAQQGQTMVRAPTAGIHPAFVSALCDLVQERLTANYEVRTVGRLGVVGQPCAPDCCPAPTRPTRPSTNRGG